jgi:hypothetical protein
MRRSEVLEHKTLNTGDVRMSPRSEVHDQTLDALRPVLEKALAGDSVAVPCFKAYRLAAKRSGKRLLFRVSRGGNVLVSGVVKEDPPRCDVRLHDALTFDPDAAMWLGDFKRCLAWCWIERERGRA